MNPTFFRRPLGRCAGGVALAVTLGLTGCGPSTGKLAGKVTLDDTPLVGGKVHVCRIDEAGHVLSTSSAEVAADGTYTSPDVSTGPAKILVQGPPLVFPMSGPPPGWQPPVDPVPLRYRQLETTDLTVVVTGGVQQYPIAIRK